MLHGAMLVRNVLLAVSVTRAFYFPALYSLVYMVRVYSRHSREYGFSLVRSNVRSIPCVEHAILSRVRVVAVIFVLEARR